MDFTLHYADLVGIYATLGLDYVSAWVFADSTDQAKCYVDRRGGEGANYPVHEQMARYFTGTMVQVERTPEGATPRVKVYAARDGERAFVMVLNKDVDDEPTVRITLPGELDLTIVLPRRSYTSLLIEGEEVLVSGIGN